MFSSHIVLFCQCPLFGHTKEWIFFLLTSREKIVHSKSWTWDIVCVCMSVQLNENETLNLEYMMSRMTYNKDLRQWNDVNREHCKRHIIHGTTYWTQIHKLDDNTWTWNCVECGNLFKIYEGKKERSSLSDETVAIKRVRLKEFSHGHHQINLIRRNFETHENWWILIKCK